MGERVSTGEQGVYPTNFVALFEDKKSKSHEKSQKSRDRKRSKSKESVTSKASSVHFTPGGKRFDITYMY